MTRVAYLGPRGTNSHDALMGAAGDWEPVEFPTVAGVVGAVQDGTAARGLVPVENSREGSVGATLDALVFDATDVVMVGELVHRVSYCLAVGEPVAPDEVRTVLSHPQATGQCARFLAEQLPAAAVLAAASTADAVRAVAEGGALAGEPPHAAIGTRHAAALYGATVLAEGIEDDPENATRFAWIARSQGSDPHAMGPGFPPATSGSDPTPEPDPAPSTIKTALVFWGAGDLAPGWLVDCLSEFSSRALSLTRIESRPRRIGLGHYMFFCDVLGPPDDPAIGAAIAGLRGHCEAVRVLGSFPARTEFESGQGGARRAP